MSEKKPWAFFWLESVFLCHIPISQPIKTRHSSCETEGRSQNRFSIPFWLDSSFQYHLDWRRSENTLERFRLCLPLTFLGWAGSLKGAIWRGYAVCFWWRTHLQLLTSLIKSSTQQLQWPLLEFVNLTRIKNNLILNSWFFACISVQQIFLFRFQKQKSTYFFMLRFFSFLFW